LNGEIKLLSKKLQGVAKDDEDVKQLMAIPRVAYYSAVLMKNEIGDKSCFSYGEKTLQLYWSSAFHAFFWKNS
jgi:hypothetical protein